MNKKPETTGQGTLPFTEAEFARSLADPTTIATRSSEERTLMRERTGQSHEEIEACLAAGLAHDVVMQSASAFVIEQTPKILHKLITDALNGNAVACKLALELSGIEEYMEGLRTAAEAGAPDDGLGPLDVGLLENLRKQIERIPDRPDPRLEP